MLLLLLLFDKGFYAIHRILFIDLFNSNPLLPLCSQPISQQSACCHVV